MSVTEIYKALADESRLRIVNVLRTGVFNVQEVTSVLGLSQSTVSHHLKVLTQNGIAVSERDGTWAFYRLHSDDPSHPASLITKGFLDLVSKGQANGMTAHIENDNQEIKKLLDNRRDKAKVFFDSVAKDWQEVRKEIQGSESYLEEVASVIDSKATLLELGCGAGALLEKVLPRSGKTFGVDYSEAMLESAKKALGDKASQVDLRLGYLEHLPIGDNSIDTAVAYMVLHHITEPLAVFHDAARVLKSGATLMVVELTTHSREEMRERYADLWLGFDTTQLSHWATEAGFTNIEIKFLCQEKNVFLLSAVKP